MTDKLKKQNIVLDEDTITWLMEEAHQNKMAGNKDLDSMSKIVRKALEEYRAARPKGTGKKGRN